jgi:hypothetical protein
LLAYKQCRERADWSRRDASVGSQRLGWKYQGSQMMAERYIPKFGHTSGIPGSIFIRYLP